MVKTKKPMITLENLQERRVCVCVGGGYTAFQVQVNQNVKVTLEVLLKRRVYGRADRETAKDRQSYRCTDKEHIERDKQTDRWTDWAEGANRQIGRKDQRERQKERERDR